MGITERFSGQLRSRLLNERAGTTTVNAVEVEPRFDAAGDEYILVTLIVSEPPPGEATWPLDDAFHLRERARQAAAEIDVPTEVEITITSAGDSDTSDELVGEEDESPGAPG